MGHRYVVWIHFLESSNFWNRFSGKDRRERGGFIGSETVLKQLQDGPSKRRVGMIVEEAPARRKSNHYSKISMTRDFLIDGAKVVAPNTNEELGSSSFSQSYWINWRFATGIVTSGIPSPTLGKNIAMVYVKSGWHKKGTEVAVEVRKQLRKAVVTPLPFVKPNYWRGQ